MFNALAERTRLLLATAHALHAVRVQRRLSVPRLRLNANVRLGLEVRPELQWPALLAPVLTKTLLKMSLAHRAHHLRRARVLTFRVAVDM